VPVISTLIMKVLSHPSPPYGGLGGCFKETDESLSHPSPHFKGWGVEKWKLTKHNTILAPHMGGWGLQGGLKGGISCK
jgi:hypothetical protein